MSASALLLPRRQSRPRLALVLLSLLLLGGSLVDRKSTRLNSSH